VGSVGSLTCPRLVKAFMRLVYANSERGGGVGSVGSLTCPRLVKAFMRLVYANSLGGTPRACMRWNTCAARDTSNGLVAEVGCCGAVSPF
jgi:hypothetical protein